MLLWQKNSVHVIFLVEKIGYGVIGCGGAGTGHARRAAKIANVRLVAVCDTSEEKAKKVKEETGAERYYLDYVELLKDKAIDAVAIALPHSLLAGTSLAAIKTGKHVLVEKPMAFNYKEAKEVVTAARRTGVKLMVSYSWRYDSGWNFMKELLKKNAVGKVELVRASWIHPVYGGGPERRPWLWNPKHNRGMLHYLGSHLIDLVLWFVDSDALSVNGHVVMDPRYSTSSREAYTIRFKNDALASILTAEGVTGTSALYFAGHNAFDVQATGAFGSVECHYQSQPTYRYIVNIYSREIVEYNNPTEFKILPSVDNGVTTEFIDSIIEDRDPAIPGEQGLKVMEIVDAVYESSKTGRTIPLPLG